MNSHDPRPLDLSGDFAIRTSPESTLAGPAAAPSIDPLTAQVVAQLVQPPEQKTWTQTLTLLVLSLVVFGAMGLLTYGPPELLLLVGVLLFHEAGHYLGMRIFDYQDVRMFFIPFFGAAVSGRSTSVAGYKQAIVILLGPLPGILLGLVVGAACLFYDDDLLRSASRMLLLINGFNLLPFLPLDGGRLLHLVLFSRQRHLEALFRLVTALLLLLCGWSLGAWVLGILGALMALSTGHTFRVSTLAQRLRGSEDSPAEMNPSAQIPPERTLPLATAVRQAFPQLKLPKPLANTARQVWDRMHVRPPGVLASIGLLGLYAAGLPMAPAALVLFERPVRTIVSRPHADGTNTNVEEVRVWGRLRAWTELNADRQYHGRHVEYAPLRGRTAVEGSFLDGLPDGTWKFYGPNEQLQGTSLFQRGQVIESVGQIPLWTPAPGG